MRQGIGGIWLASSLAFSCLLGLSPVQGQIVPDQTLPLNSKVMPGCTHCTIDGGTVRGINLYHSFSQFSVPTDGSAWFNNAPQIQNILTRVTGITISNIDGLLKTNGTANLFLLNPNGIVFGPHASLQIGGSFLATTASSLKFADGSEFSATKPQAPPLLTVNVTPGLQYGPNAASISNRGNLNAQQDLTLAASNLNVQGTVQAGRDLTLQAQDTVQVRDTIATPLIAVAGRTLQVQGDRSVDIFTLNHPSSGFWSGGNLVLRSGNSVVGDAHFYAGGNFQVEQLDGKVGNLLSPHDPIILTDGDVTLGDYTGASLHILAEGSVTLNSVTITGAGDVATTINPNNTTLFNSSRSYADLATFNLTTYKATLNSDGTVRSVDPVAVPMTVNGSTQATLDVRAGVDWVKLGGLPTTPVLAGVVTPALTATATASSANITLNGAIRVAQPAGLVLLTNQFRSNTLPGTISIRRSNVDTSTTIPDAAGGNIEVYGRGDITIVNPNSMFASLKSSSFSNFGTTGNGGDISISTNSGNISLANSPLGSYSLSSSGLGDAGTARTAGNGGDISISTNSGNISLTSSSLASSSTSSLYLRNAGNGGGISLTTNSGNISLTSSPLYVASSSETIISSNPGNAGNGGAISFATNSGNISLTGSDLNSSSLSYLRNAGNGGGISLTTNSGNISLLYSLLTSSSFSFRGTAGSGGSIELSARGGAIAGSASFVNSYAVSAQGSSGRAGKVMLDAGTEISGLTINTVASGGPSGDVVVNGFGNLQVFDTRILTAQQVTVNTPSGPVTIPLNDRGQAGNVTVASMGSLTVSNSTIASDTRGGNPAGDISFNANQGITLTDGSTISARTTSGGQAGNISFNAPILMVSGDAQVLAETTGSGSGGSIFVNAPTSVELRRTNNVSPVLSVETSGAGKAGDIFVNTQTLTLADQARITATATATSTNLQGGGNVTLNASTMDLAGIVGVFAETQGAAAAGTLRLKPYNNQPDLNIILTPNAKISASTSGSGKGGDLIVTAPRSITLSGPGKLAVETSSSGNAGNINISTGNLTLTNGVEVSASTSASGRGGNIDLNLKGLLLLRRFSSISTSASQSSTGDGGDITISAPFIVGIPNENSDITANAFNGRGGKVTINVDRTFYMVPRSRAELVQLLNTNDPSQLDPRRLPSNDITAISQGNPNLNGIVTLTNLNLDPTSGLTELNVNPVDSSRLIAPSCITGKQVTTQANRFTITGRSGLPSSPEDVMSSDRALDDLGALAAPSTQTLKTIAPQSTQSTDRPNQIIEAQGWGVDANGKASLVVESSSDSPNQEQTLAVNCATSSK